MSEIGILNWMGSKVLLSDWIIDNFPPHDIYVELFGGSAAVLTHKERSRVEVYNDLNSEVVNFFRCLQEYPERMVAKLELMPYSREVFNELNKEKQLVLDPIEQACRFFFLNRARINGMGGFSTSITAHSTECSVYDRRIEDLRTFSRRFRGVIIENLDFQEVIDRYDSSQCLFYVDPPYVLAGPNRYYGKPFTKADHKRLAQKLFSIEGTALVSYYPNALVSELYPSDKCKWISKTVRKASANTANTDAEELLILINHRKSKETLSN